MLALGAQAPDFTLPDDLGNNVSLRALLAKAPVVLMFYPSDGTPICTKEACVVRDRFDALAKSGLSVVGISAQGTQSKAAFRKAHNLRHILLAEADFTIGGLGVAVAVGQIIEDEHAQWRIGLGRRILQDALERIKPV